MNSLMNLSDGITIGDFRRYHEEFPSSSMEDCKKPCIPRPMIGRSWWKCLGYNSPCKCCHIALEKTYPICCLCDKRCKNKYGNNAEPLGRGICCRFCNNKYVIPTQLYITEKRLEAKKEGEIEWKEATISAK